MQFAGLRSSSPTRRSVIAGACGAVLASAAGGASAGEGPLPVAGVILLMAEDPGCPYCARFDREVGPIYPKSPEGRFAPLHRRFRRDRALAFLADLRFSPTFVLLKDGVEVGRIVGYPGEDFFWGELSRLVAAAGFRSAAAG